MRALILSLCVLLCSCTSRTEFGECVGVADAKDPGLVYKLSGWNLFWGLIGWELMFIPPIVVLVDQTFCPVGKK